MPVMIDGTNYPTLDEMIAVLRSDKYKQVNGALEMYRPSTGEAVGNCCLGAWARETGLLAQRYGGDTRFAFPVPRINEQNEVELTELWQASTPTEYFMSHYGMTACGAPQVLVDGKIYGEDWDGKSCVGMNDDNVPFALIADQLQAWKDAGWIHDPVKPTELPAHFEEVVIGYEA